MLNRQLTGVHCSSAIECAVGCRACVCSSYLSSFPSSWQSSSSTCHSWWTDRCCSCAGSGSGGDGLCGGGGSGASCGSCRLYRCNRGDSSAAGGGSSVAGSGSCGSQLLMSHCRVCNDLTNFGVTQHSCIVLSSELQPQERQFIILPIALIFKCHLLLCRVAQRFREFSVLLLKCVVLCSCAVLCCAVPMLVPRSSW